MAETTKARVAFSHDDSAAVAESRKPDAYPASPPKGWRKNMTGPKVIGLILILFALLILWLNNRGTVKQTAYDMVSKSSVRKTEAKKALGPRSGIMEINDYSWHGVSTLNKKMSITGRILDNDLVWMVRFNGDDNRVYKLYPPTWGKPDEVFTYKNGYSLMEWMLSPNQHKRTSKVAWEIDWTPGEEPR